MQAEKIKLMLEQESIKKKQAEVERLEQLKQQ